MCLHAPITRLQVQTKIKTMLEAIRSIILCYVPEIHPPHTHPLKSIFVQTVFFAEHRPKFKINDKVLNKIRYDALTTVKTIPCFIVHF